LQKKKKKKKWREAEDVIRCIRNLVALNAYFTVSNNVIYYNKVTSRGNPLEKETK
jgi:hypothetical protein